MYPVFQSSSGWWVKKWGQGWWPMFDIHCSTGLSGVPMNGFTDFFAFRNFGGSSQWRRDCWVSL